MKSPGPFQTPLRIDLESTVRRSRSSSKTLNRKTLLNELCPDSANSAFALFEGAPRAGCCEHRKGDVLIALNQPRLREDLPPGSTRYSSGLIPPYFTSCSPSVSDGDVHDVFFKPVTSELAHNVAHAYGAARCTARHTVPRAARCATPSSTAFELLCCTVCPA